MAIKFVKIVDGKRIPVKNPLLAKKEISKNKDKKETEEAEK